MQSWCRTWPPNGSSRIRAKQTLLRKHKRSLQKFLEPDRNPKVIYTDNSLEFGKACEDLSWNHCTSTPHRSETNGIAERAVRRVKEGTSAVLLQSGLDEKWWECYTYLRNIQDLLYLMERLHTKDVLENHLEAQSFRLVHWLSITLFLRNTNQESINLERKSYLDCSLDTLCTRGKFCRVTYWLQTLRSWRRWTHRKSTQKRLNAKEVIFPKEKGEFIFPIADGRIKFAGGDQELKTSTLIREHPIRGEGQRDFLGESEGSPPTPHQDSLPDASEARNDFWSMSGNTIHRHHVEPRVKLYSPREESFPIPLKRIDVSSTTHTNLDVLQESRIDDYWNIDGSRDLSDSWTGFTQFTPQEEKPPNGHTRPRRD